MTQRFAIFCGCACAALITGAAATLPATALIPMAITVLAGAVLIGAIRHVAVAWVAFVVALGSSGMTVTLGPLTLLPEHLATLLLASHMPRLPVSSARTRNMNAPFALASLWIAMNFVSSALSPHAVASVRLALWLSASLVAAVVAYKVLSARPDLVRYLALTLTAYGAAAIVGWSFGGTEAGTVFVERDYASDFHRAKGLMLEPNLLASFLVVGLAVSIALRHLVPVKILYLQSAVTAVVVALSVTRVAYVVLGALLLAAFLLLRGRRLTVFTVVAPIIVLAYLFSGPLLGDSADVSSIASAIGNRANSFFSLSSGTGSYRLTIAEIALAEIRDSNTLFGSGTNAFTITHSTDTSSDGQLYLGIWWLSLIYDTGLVGALIVAGMLIALIRVGGASAVGMIAVAGLFAAATNPMWYAFPWVFVAIAVALSKNLPGHLDDATRKRGDTYADPL